MSVPDPATTNWVPLQGRPSGAAYFGQYQASGHTYYDGDCVIGSDGILYMCVTDGTTTPPVAWPGAPAPQGVAGPQGPQGVGIPMPVVNGSWIKGIGGAAVWSTIAQTDLPSNLSTYGATAPGKDLNNATAAGWYGVSQDSDQWGPTLNRPFSYGVVQTIGMNAGTIRQIGYQHGLLDLFHRQYSSNTWRVWVQTYFGPPIDVNWRSVVSDGYVNGFSDYAAPYGPCQYRKLASGLVVCQGLMNCPGPGLAFTPAPGYRCTPGRNLIFHTASSAAVATETWRLDGNGSFVYQNGASWSSIAGISYYADG